MTTTQEVLNKELEEIIIARCGRVYARRLIKDLENLCNNSVKNSSTTTNKRIIAT
jgi:hypothetical protein